jgi:F-type H+-transporting ATPase subunit b
MKAKMIVEAEASASEEAQRIIASAKEAIEQEKREALAEIKVEVAKLSVTIAEKLMKVELSNTTKEASFVNDLLKEVHLK